MTPNILFIMADDHAAHAISAYGSRINRTPHLDRIANGGMRFDNCFCTNSICTPSRAVILTGTHSHISGVTTLATPLDNRLLTFPKLLQQAGYQTALFGKWHLGQGPAHCPTGFDNWAVLPDHGCYFNSDFVFKDTGKRVVPGYITDVITDMSLDWLKQRDRSKPFCLLTHHKAPHRQWLSDGAHAGMYLGETIPEPDNLQDDYRNRAFAAQAAAMRVGVHMNQGDLQTEINRALPEAELRAWAYQRYTKAYLRVVASIDDNVGRMLDCLDAEGLTRDTLVIYTSDQGFFRGDHGWFDKRFMYEESLRMPFLLRYPREVKPGSVNADMVSNLDFAPLFTDLAGIPTPKEFQGRSFRPLLQGRTPSNWRAPDWAEFRLVGLGIEWAARGIAWGNGASAHNLPNPRLYGNVLFVPEAWQRGKRGAMTTKFESSPDGSGLVTANLDDVYLGVTDSKSQPSEVPNRRASDVGVRGTRSLAVDHSGKSGAPCLVAVADQVTGTKVGNVWQFCTLPEHKVTVTATGFTIVAGSGANLVARVVQPAAPKITVQPVTIRHEINYHGRHNQADFKRQVISVAGNESFFVVLTIQKDAAPTVRLEGEVAVVGKRKVCCVGPDVVLE